MKKYYSTLLFFISIFIFGACSSNNVPIIDDVTDGKVEIIYSKSNFKVTAWDGTRSTGLRATDIGDASEQKIDNIYLFLFDKLDVENSKGYYISGDSFEGGKWDKNESNGKVTLNLTQSEAGAREVYIIANYGTGMSYQDGSSTISYKSFTSADDLNKVYNTTNNPWSKKDLGYPNATISNNNPAIIMSGSSLSHNFVDKRTLSSVNLTRALAKIDITINLTSKHQSPLFIQKDGGNESIPQYLFNFERFDKNTYAFADINKSGDITNSDWKVWNNSDFVTTIDDQNNVTKLSIVTYINETTNKTVKDSEGKDARLGSFINIQLPYKDDGFLPPPEFGLEFFQLPLPEKVERNTWYKYDVTI